MRKRPLMLMAGVFLAGLVYQRYSVKLMAVIVGCLVFREWFYGRQTKRYLKTAGRSILLLSAFLLGIFHMRQEEAFREAYMSKLKDGSRVTVWGELIKMESTEYGNRGILSDCYIKFGEGTLPCNDIMVYTSKDQLQIGQIHKITGKVNMLSKAQNEGNFDSQVYYQSLKIDFAVDEETSASVGIGRSAWNSFLLSFKEKISNVYVQSLSKKAAGFYQAMVLGDKINLDENLKDLFLFGGISHILAISGLHVSILGRGIYGILRRGGIGFGTAGICSGFLLIFYCVMVGSSTSTLRAVGMMLFFFLAQWIGRSYDMLNALGGMVLFLLLENPFLIENSGFWFSVTALLGVGFIGKNVSEIMRIHQTESVQQKNQKGSKKKKIRKGIDFSGFWMSLGITLTTLPVTALSYYEIPLYSPLVNFIVLPVLTPIFCLAVIGGILGCFLPLGSITFLLQPCEWLLAFYEWVCQTVAKLPWACVICGKPDVWQVVLYYILLFGGMYLLGRMQDKCLKKSLNGYKKVLLGGILLVCLLCIFWPKSKEFEISFLDVGQGDGIYISAGDGTSYFIDGGSSSVNHVGENRILPFLKSKGIKAIDYWFVSHVDSDHVSGLYEVLEKGYKVEHIVLSEHCSSDGIYDNLRHAARDSGAKIIYMDVGDKVCSEDTEFTCVGPLAENDAEIFEDRNDNSLVLLLEHKDFKALFAGDISTEVENALCESGDLCDVDLVKANHHGSNYSNGELWFEVTRPEYIVVSCGKNNIYGHPGAKAIARMEACGAEIFYTMENGQIRFPLIQ